ncbi:MAG: hypothetical protein J7500_05105 [Sphingomonas sp.]|uniref:hypothetical protein n=1 Tax=Sphingomonas sp. TaxID=28214 RepID=UPI001B1DE2F1|nr:hypothetical protein [Sphingomonas sp.]MBO9622072.1 hypothetical protein [Sphingomonas sp.]
MDLMQIAASEIAELDMPVAVHGAFTDLEASSVDGLFEMIVGVVELIYEMAPI